MKGKELTEAQKERLEKQKERLEKRKEKQAKKDAIAQRKNLKEVALVGKEPKPLPSTAWQVLSIEAVKGTKGAVTENFKAASTKYKSLSPEELEVSIILSRDWLAISRLTLL